MSLQPIDIEFYHSIPKGDREEWLFERTACDKSLYYFIIQMGGAAKDAGGDSSPVIHKPLCDFWQDDSIKRKAVAMPRAWFKSTNLTKWGNIWRYLQNNERRILIPSQKEDLGVGFLHWMQLHIIGHQRLRWVYPVLQQVDKSWTRSHRFSNRECDLPRDGVYSEPTFRTIGIGGAAQSGHYDYINPDDLIGESGMESQLVMEDAFRWFDNIEELLVDPHHDRPSGSVCSVVGTHWSLADLFCYIQEKYLEYKWMIVPCLKDGGLKDTKSITWHQNPNQEQGESNWPEMFTTDHYTEMRAHTEKSFVFWSQHMNNPGRAEGGFNKFDKAWIKYYDLEEREIGTYLIPEDAKGDEAYKLTDIPLYGFIDPGGFSELKLSKGSRSAILIGGQPRNSVKKFVIHTYAGKFKEPQTFLDEIFAAHETYKPRIWRIDTAAQQHYIYKDILEERRRRHSHLSISPLKPDVKADSKDGDILALVNPMFNGEIYLHRGMKNLVAEIGNFPQGITKDLVDCLGKLNKIYWHRRNLDEVARQNRGYEYTETGRDVVTGY